VWLSFKRYGFKNCLVTSCYFQASSHFRNPNTFNLQDWLALILEFDQKNISVKIPFERSISWFQNNKKTKKIYVSFKDEMWPQNKMQDGKIHNKNDWQFSTILGSAFLAISVFCRATSITCYSDDVLVTKWSMTSSFTNSARFLKLLHLSN
jgi:hypothetical protein